MDDVYYGVLRVWHLLTSNKKVFVAVLGVVVVVAAVTTVVAAPTQETGELVAEQVSSLPAVPDADAQMVNGYEKLTVGDVSSPGVLPSSPFYPLKVVARELTLAFTFDPVSKAERYLRYANEDLLAVHEMYDTNEVLAARQCVSYEDNFWNSILWVAKAGREGHDVGGALASLRMSHDSHRLVLADVLTVVDDVNGVAVVMGAGGGGLRDAVIEAAAATSAELEFAILVLQGEQEANRFHAQLQSDFSVANRVVWLEVENRLGLPAEQAIALSAAIGDEGTGAIAGMPIITSMHVDNFRVEPGQSCTITCNATDFENDPLTYQWLATKGEVQGEGPVVTWTAPDDVGEYRISVVVSDAAGNQSSKAVTVVVGDPQEQSEGGGSFSIEEMEVVPMGHNLLKPPALGTTQWTIFKGREVEITCVIDGDASGLEYEWTCDVGSLHGDGSTVVWEAPDHACYAQVAVVVSGGNGDSEEETLTFRVSTCGTCF